MDIFSSILEKKGIRMRDLLCLMNGKCNSEKYTKGYLLYVDKEIQITTKELNRRKSERTGIQEEVFYIYNLMQPEDIDEEDPEITMDMFSSALEKKGFTMRDLLCHTYKYCNSEKYSKEYILFLDKELNIMTKEVNQGKRERRNMMAEDKAIQII
jgi:hypothetical protein